MIDLSLVSWVVYIIIPHQVLRTAQDYIPVDPGKVDCLQILLAATW